MRIASFLIGLAALAAVSGCGDTYFERGASGALIGAGAAAVMDEDPATGAVIGGGVGILTK